MSAERNRSVGIWVYAVALLLLAMGAAGIVNLFAPPSDRLGGSLAANVMMMLAPGFIAGGVLTLWIPHLLKTDTEAEDFLILSKRFGRISMLLIFVVPIIAGVGVSATMKPEAGWIFFFVPAYVSITTGIAVLIFSGVLSHLGRRGH